MDTRQPEVRDPGRAPAWGYRTAFWKRSQVRGMRRFVEGSRDVVWEKRLRVLADWCCSLLKGAVVLPSGSKLPGGYAGR
jgi:hypothetical protein